MNVVAFTRKYPLGLAAISFALGGATALLGVWQLGTPWNSERVVERTVERVVERVVEKPAPPPAVPPAARPEKPRRVDLVVMQMGKPLGLDSEFREYFVDEARKLPGVEQVSESVVGVANTIRPDGSADDTVVVVQGWKPDNFGYEDVELVEGRKLRTGDRNKAILGRLLAESLKKKVGNALTFVSAPDHPYEVVGVFKSRVVFEEGGAIVPFEDGQRLHGKPGRVTGFSVRVKKTPPDPAAEVEAVKQKIEALRDPEAPTVRLSAEPPERDVRPKPPASP
ncbi:MAG: ABC transporter permease [Planctomycetes bacterium]|nr:ABC transporter permease [Planctomycetota bacterium]